MLAHWFKIDAQHFSSWTLKVEANGISNMLPLNASSSKVSIIWTVNKCRSGLVSTVLVGHVSLARSVIRYFCKDTWRYVIVQDTHKLVLKNIPPYEGTEHLSICNSPEVSACFEWSIDVLLCSKKYHSSACCSHWALLHAMAMLLSRSLMGVVFEVWVPRICMSVWLNIRMESSTASHQEPSVTGPGHVKAQTLNAVRCDMGRWYWTNMERWWSGDTGMTSKILYFLIPSHL